MSRKWGQKSEGRQSHRRSDEILSMTIIVLSTPDSLLRGAEGGGGLFLTSPSSVAREELALGVLAESPCQGCSQDTVG